MEKIMKRYSFQTLSILIISLIVASQSFASWQKESVTSYNDDGSVANIVNFWVNQSGQQSSFTIYKRGGGMRVYITFFGATWPEFKRYMKFNSSELQTADKYAPNLPEDVYKILGLYGGINMLDTEFDGKITLGIGMSDYFYNQYGKQVEVAINIIGHPKQVGAGPNITIEVDNADIRQLIITYPKPATKIEGTKQTPGKVVSASVLPVVIIKCNKTTAQKITHGGNIGGVIVNGGCIRSTGRLRFISCSFKKVSHRQKESRKAWF